MADLSFAQLRRANTERCAPPWFRETIDEWSPCDWVTALVGEVGEAANLIKKVHRGDFQIDDPLPNDLQKRTVRQAIADELADVACYLDLLAQRCGVDLGTAVIRKFNIVSDRVSCPIKLGDR